MFFKFLVPDKQSKLSRYNSFAKRKVHSREAFKKDAKQLLTIRGGGVVPSTKKHLLTFLGHFLIEGFPYLSTVKELFHLFFIVVSLLVFSVSRAEQQDI